MRYPVRSNANIISFFSLDNTEKNCKLAEEPRIGDETSGFSFTE